MINAATRIQSARTSPYSPTPRAPRARRIKEALAAMVAERRELTHVIDGEAVASDKRLECARRTASAGGGDPVPGWSARVELAIKAAEGAKAAWAALPFDERAGVFLRAADLLAGRYRFVANAATMLGQSKTVHQAEIDSACELIDFWRFNPLFARRLMEDQPISAAGTWNRVDYRPLDGSCWRSPVQLHVDRRQPADAPALMGTPWSGSRLPPRPLGPGDHGRAHRGGLPPGSSTWYTPRVG